MFINRARGRREVEYKTHTARCRVQDMAYRSFIPLEHSLSLSFKRDGEVFFTCEDS